MAKSSEPASGMALISKAGAVLRLLAEHGELTVAEFAGHTGEPASSLYRLLSSLEELGWVEAGSRRGKTRLGLDLVRLGQCVEDRLDLRAVAVPALRSLHEATGQTVFLLVRRGLRAACIERLDGLDVEIHSLRLGESMPLGQGVAPRALLAFETDDVVREYLVQMPTDEHFGVVASDAPELGRQLATIVASGVSVSRGDLGPGIGGVGAPIFDYRGDVVAAVSISGLTHRLFDSGFDPVDLVVQAAGRISRGLGATVTAGVERAAVGQ